MQTNFWLYANGSEQTKAAGPLIAFGAEVAAKANVLQGLDTLRACNDAIQNNRPYNQIAVAQVFAFDYLVDCIRILIFFENYMKAELILNGFCVHTIDRSNQKRLDLIQLAKQQEKRPVTLSEIELVEPFLVDAAKEIIHNIGLRDNTIGMSILLKDSYREYYLYDDEILRTIKQINSLRNKLHFNVGAEFHLSTQFIDDMDRIRSFIYLTAARLVPIKKAPAAGTTEA